MTLAQVKAELKLPEISEFVISYGRNGQRWFKIKDSDLDIRFGQEARDAIISDVNNTDMWYRGVDDFIEIYHGKETVADHLMRKAGYNMINFRKVHLKIEDYGGTRNSIWMRYWNDKTRTCVEMLGAWDYVAVESVTEDYINGFKKLETEKESSTGIPYTEIVFFHEMPEEKYHWDF